MKKTQGRKRAATKTKKRAPAVQRSSCRALVPLDTDTIRKAEFKKLERGKAAYAKAEAQLAHFEQHEQKAYSRWIHDECGSMLEDLNRLGNEARLAMRRIDLTLELMAFYRSRTSQACAEAAECYFAGEGEIPAGFEEFFQPPPDPFASDEDPENGFGEECEEAFEKGFDEFLRDLLGESGFGSLVEAPRENLKRDVKELYRKIVRCLHPDRDADTNPRRLALWHEAQQAYKHHDLATLERILSDCELLEPASARIAPVSSIRSGIEQFKRGLRTLRSRIRIAKREPEWGFLSWNETRKKRELEAIRKAIHREFCVLSVEAGRLRQEFDRLRHPAAPRKDRKRAPTPFIDPQQADFEFF